MSASAGCTGGLASTTLSCTGPGNSLTDFETWASGTYVTNAVDSVVSQIVALFDPSKPNLKGEADVQDSWGGGGNRFSTNSLNYGSYTGIFGYINQQKGPSAFTVNGLVNSDNSAYFGVKVNWTVTILENAGGVLKYIIDYTYTYGGNAWAKTQDNPFNGASGSVNGSGSGSYTYSKGATVPGPVAGAGLPVLIGALAWYRARRKAAAL